MTIRNVISKSFSNARAFDISTNNISLLKGQWQEKACKISHIWPNLSSHHIICVTLPYFKYIISLLGDPIWVRYRPDEIFAYLQLPFSQVPLVSHSVTRHNKYFHMRMLHKGPQAGLKFFLFSSKNCCIFKMYKTSFLI